jgi:hypothetical protein
LYTIIASFIVPFLFLDLRVHALVLSFIVGLVLYMRFARCSIAWFPGIVLVGFLLAKVCPLYMFLVSNAMKTRFAEKEALIVYT